MLQAVREEPNARHLLGVIAYQREDATAAVDLIGRAAEALVNVGPVHAISATRCGRPDEAVASYRQALTLRPDVAPAHAGLAHALNDLGRHAAALDAARQAAALDPKLFDASVQATAALSALGRLAELGTAYQQALRIDLVGLATEAKGTDLFLDIAREMAARSTVKVACHHVGRLAHRTDPAPFQVLADPPLTEYLSRETFTTRLAALHYVLLPIREGTIICQPVAPSWTRWPGPNP